MLVQNSPARNPAIRVSGSDREPLYRQIIQQIRRAVKDQLLRPADRLPSVRALAQQLVVNPNTVARAYGDLSREGVIEARPGRGVFIASSKRRASAAATTVLFLCSADQFPDDAPNLAVLSLVRSLESEFAHAGRHLRLMIVGDHDERDGAKITDALAKRDIAAVITVGDLGPVWRHLPSELPVATTGTWLPIRTPWIGDDVEAITREMVNRLIAQGHREIALVCDSWSDGRAIGLFAAGHRAAFEGAGLVWPRQLVFHALPGEPIEELASRIVTGPNRPTAIFAQHWPVCRGVLTAAERLGLRVPDDLSLASYGKNIVHLPSPVPITTWLPDYAAAGVTLARLATDLIEGAETPERSFINGRVRAGCSIQKID